MRHELEKQPLPKTGDLPQIFVARAPPETGPDKIQVVIRCPHPESNDQHGRLFLLELEGSYNGTFVKYLKGDSLLRGHRIDHPMTAQELETFQVGVDTTNQPIYKFKLLNESMGYTFADSLIQWLNYKAKKSQVINLLRKKDFPSDAITYIKDYLYTLDANLNSEDHLSDIHPIATVTSIPSTPTNHTDPKAIGRDIQRLFKYGRIAALGKQGSLTIFTPDDEDALVQSEHLIERARQSQLELSKRAAAKLAASMMIPSSASAPVPAQVRMLEAIGQATSQQSQHQPFSLQQQGAAQWSLLYLLGGLGVLGMLLPLLLPSIANLSTTQQLMVLMISSVYIIFGLIARHLTKSSQPSAFDDGTSNQLRSSVLSIVRNWQLLGSSQPMLGPQASDINQPVQLPDLIWSAIGSMIRVVGMLPLLAKMAKGFSQTYLPLPYLIAWARVHVRPPTVPIRSRLSSIWRSHRHTTWSRQHQKHLIHDLLHLGLDTHPNQHFRLQLLALIAAMPMTKKSDSLFIHYQGQSFQLPQFAVESSVLSSLLQRWGIRLPNVKRKPRPSTWRQGVTSA